MGEATAHLRPNIQSNGASKLTVVGSAVWGSYSKPQALPAGVVIKTELRKCICILHSG
jgi:hypothetical protein